MGILKDAIRLVIEKDAKEKGLDIRFIDSPTRMIENSAQAKQHDMERLEKPDEHQYADIVYKHNPSAYKESDLLLLYVFDLSTEKVVGYLSFAKSYINVCTGCAFGDYNMWREGCNNTAFGLNARSLNEATEYFENVFKDTRYKFIITSEGMAYANNLMKGGKK